MAGQGLGTLGVTCAVAARAAVTEMFFPLFVWVTEKLAGVAQPLPAAAADVPPLTDEFCKGADACSVLAAGGLARVRPFGHRHLGEEVALPQTRAEENGSKLIGASLGSDLCSNSLKGGVR